MLSVKKERQSYINTHAWSSGRRQRSAKPFGETHTVGSNPTVCSKCRGGRVARQWSAKPRTAVRIRSVPQPEPDPHPGIGFFFKERSDGKVAKRRGLVEAGEKESAFCTRACAMNYFFNFKDLTILSGKIGLHIAAGCRMVSLLEKATR